MELHVQIAFSGHMCIANNLARSLYHLIAVDLATDTQTGWYTGAIADTPSFREGKVTRVEQWLQSRATDLRHANATFYSNSINDLLPLLDLLGAAA